MTKIESIALEAAKPLLRGKVALVAGQQLLTRNDRATIETDLIRIAGDYLQDDSIKERLCLSNFKIVLDEFAGASPQDYEKFRRDADKYLEALQPTHEVKKLARINWAGIISLSLDICLEEAIRARLSSLPTQLRATIVSSPVALGRTNFSLPIFKLLGNCREHGEPGCVALSDSETLLRTQMWPQMLHSFSDYLRDGTLVVLGSDQGVEIVRSLFSTLFSGVPPFPNDVIFLETDPCGRDIVINRMLTGRCNVHRIDTQLQELLEHLDIRPSHQMSLSLVGGGGVTDRWAQLTPFKSIIDVVPSTKPTHTFDSHRQEILDTLFRPHGTKWDPFFFDVDLPRDFTSIGLSNLVGLHSRREQRPLVSVIRGEAAVGKTVIAKRIAIELAKAGHLVLWCKKAPIESFSLIRELARSLRDLPKVDGEPGVFLFCDDPWLLGMSPVELTSIFDGLGVALTIVFVMRNTDRAMQHGSMRLPYPIDDENEIDFELSSTEEANLSSFFVKIGATRNEAEAKLLLSELSGNSAKDILCRLWYFVPDCREQVERSLGDEYFRLEVGDRTMERLADTASSQSAVARHAYECVTITSALGLGLPTEVLVSALKVNYSTWIEISGSGRPLWGLLYPAENLETDQVFYYTRNEVVTNVLLRHINGGVGWSKSLNTIKELVGACTGSGPVYREFLIELLARQKKKLREFVSPREGRELFEIALKSFPLPDRTLSHHFGKWVSDEEHKFSEAYQILQGALDTKEYPYAGQDEPREFIHTSMAAVVVQRVVRGEQDRESGLIAIKRHLREASNPSFFNLYTVHVQVNSLLRLQKGDDPISLDCFIEACRAIERAQQLAGGSARRGVRHHDALELLENQKRELTEALAPFSTLREDALARFDNDGNPLILEAIALKGLIEASLDDKGKKYNDVSEFLTRCQNHLLKKHQHLTAELRQVRIDLAVRWKLQHPIGELDWNEFIGDIRIVRDSVMRRDDVLLLFYEAVACFHMRLSAEAQALFTRLRAIQLPSGIARQERLYLRSRKGEPEQVQATYLKIGPREYVHLNDYQYDVPVIRSRPPAGVRDGGIVHLWVTFSLQGPQAEFRPLQPSDLLLPI